MPISGQELEWSDALIGAGVGFVGVWLPFVFGYRKLRNVNGDGPRRREAGHVAGAWFGWPCVVFTMTAGALQSLVAVALMLLLRGKTEEPESVVKDREELQLAAAEGDEEAKKLIEEDPLATAPGEGILAARLPFGPFMCVAILEWMLAGEWMRERFQSLVLP